MRGRWVLWGLLIFMLAPTSVGAQTDGTRRTFSFDSRYAVRAYSNDAVARFGLDALNLTTVPAELIDPSNRLRNAGQGVLLLVGSTIMGQAFTLSYHEYGHGTRVAAAGYRPLYGFGTISTDADIQAARLAGLGHESFFGYFLSSFFKSSGYTLGNLDDLLFPPISEEELEENGWTVLLATSGLSNEMLFSERIEDEIYRNGGHIGYLTTYANGKLAASNYELDGVFGDLGNAVTRYGALGIDVDEDQIDSASRNSFFFSSMSYQLIYQTLRMFTGSSIRFTAWEPGGVQLPNTSFFMTRRGLSYRVRTGYRTGTWRIPLAVERVFEGDAATEVTIGVERNLSRTYLHARATVGAGFGLAAEAVYRVKDRVALTAGYALYDSDNMLGERLIPSLESGSRYHDLFVRVSFAY